MLTPRSARPQVGRTERGSRAARARLEADTALVVGNEVVAAAKPTPSGICSAAGGDPSGGMPTRGGHPRWSLATRQLRRRSRRLQGSAPPQAGIRAAGFRSAESRSRTKEKRTESVSPPSSSPDRPSPKRLPGGSAFVLRRSVLGALGNLPANSTTVKRSERDEIANCDIYRPRALFAMDSPREREFTQKCTEVGAPSSDLPTDLRRSVCLSESHQPRALLPRCTRDTRPSGGGRQAVSETRRSLFAIFSLQ